MPTLAALIRLVEDLRAAHRHGRVERAIRDLPPELLRDIGWPEAGRDRLRARRARRP